MNNNEILKLYLTEKKFHNSNTSKKHLIKKFPFLKEYIENNENFSAQIYCLINDIKYPKCEICNEHFQFISFKKGVLKNCKNKCKNITLIYQGTKYTKYNFQILICEKHKTYISEKNLIH